MRDQFYVVFNRETVEVHKFDDIQEVRAFLLREISRYDNGSKSQEELHDMFEVYKASQELEFNLTQSITLSTRGKS